MGVAEGERGMGEGEEGTELGEGDMGVAEGERCMVVGEEGTEVGEGYGGGGGFMSSSQGLMSPGFGQSPSTDRRVCREKGVCVLHIYNMYVK